MRVGRLVVALMLSSLGALPAYAEVPRAPRPAVVPVTPRATAARSKMAASRSDAPLPVDAVARPESPSRRNAAARRDAVAQPRTATRVARLAPASTRRRMMKPVCLREATEVQRGGEAASFALTECDGKPAPFAVEHLSLLARPGTASAPAEGILALARTAGPNIAPGVRRLDPRLIERLQAAVDHFGGKARIVLVSGYRPISPGSYHASARALDFRLEGVKNEELVAFCKTFADTGCGYYPNSGFVHLDVRDWGAGRFAWVDASGPGERPRYVAAWPPSPDAGSATAAAADEHSSTRGEDAESRADDPSEPSGDGGAGAGENGGNTSADVGVADPLPPLPPKP